MATVISARANAKFPVFEARGMSMACAYGVEEIATIRSAADIDQLCRIPKCTVINGFLMSDDLDTNATETLELDVGWAANGVEAADADGFLNSGLLNGDAVANHVIVASINVHFAVTLLPATFSAETIVQTVTTVVAATAGLGTLQNQVYYVENQA